MTLLRVCLKVEKWFSGIAPTGRYIPRHCGQAFQGNALGREHKIKISPYRLSGVINQAARRVARNSPQQPVNNSAEKRLSVATEKDRVKKVTHRPGTNDLAKTCEVCFQIFAPDDTLWH